MNGDPRHHPCGFCGAEVHQFRCVGCGVWWTQRNFSFPSGNYGDLPNKGVPELLERVYERPSPGKTMVWSGYDEDDSQVMEVFAAECEGWLCGENFRGPTSSLFRDDDDTVLDLVVSAPFQSFAPVEVDFDLFASLPPPPKPLPRPAPKWLLKPSPPTSEVLLAPDSLFKADSLEKSMVDQDAEKAELLKVGYTEEEISVYRGLKSLNLEILDSQKIAEAFLALMTEHRAGLQKNPS